MPMSPVARCTRCAWTLEARDGSDQELVRVAGELDEHLTLQHQVPWQESSDLAFAWLARARLEVARQD